MGKAYKCDRCENYFDKTTDVPETIKAGVKITGQWDILHERYEFNRKRTTYLCPDCACELGQLIGNWWEPKSGETTHHTVVVNGCGCRVEFQHPAGKSSWDYCDRHGDAETMRSLLGP